MTTNQLEMNFAPTSVPSISSSAMLVEMSISLWTGKRLDKRASEEAASANNAQKGVARVTKDLLFECAELDALVKFGANVRNMHYNSTLPWSDMGPRLLPTTKFFAYQQMITRLQTEFNRMVNNLIDVYDLEVAQQQAKMGDLYNPDEYPTAEQLRAKFAFRINYIPLPDAGDWRLDIGNEALASLQEQYQAHYAGQLDTAMRDIWTRLYKTLSTLSAQLSDQTADGKTPKLYQSVFDRALEIIDMMETCNITGDTTMQVMQRRLSQAFKGVTLDAVKDDAYLRRETKQAIDAAIKNLPSLEM
jgi:hypothetical protein